MGLLENVLGSAVPSGNYSKPLMIAVMALLASGALTRRSATQTPNPAPSDNPAEGSHGGLLGGLGGLLDRFRESGYGDVINSWIGSGENRPIAPNHMGTALGPDIVKSLSQKSGLSEQELLAQLSRILPGVV